MTSTDREVAHLNKLKVLDLKHDQEKTVLEHSRIKKDFDYILEQIGPLGRYQVLHWILLSIVIIVSGIQNLLNVFLVATPEHWCHVPELTNLTVTEQQQLTAPSGESLSNGRDGSCTIRDVDYGEVYRAFMRNETTMPNVSGTRSCLKWDYDYDLYGTTAVTKWDLVCSKSSLPALSQSIYMTGFLLGAILCGYIADRYGRKIAMYGSLVAVIVFTLLSSFTPEFWSHVIIRMTGGVAACGTITVPFVMVMEMIGPTKRLIPGLMAQVFFAIGYMGVAGVAYWIRDFFWTNIVLSSLPIVLLGMWWTEPESTRWLLAQGRLEEAKALISTMVKVNKSKVDVDMLLQEYVNYERQKQQVAPRVARNYTIIDTVRTPNMRKKSLNIMFNWLVISMVYYGLSLGVTDVGGDPYLNLFLSGAMECCSVFVACAVLDRFGRRICLTISLLIGGIACLVNGILSPEYAILKIVLTMIGKFGVSGGFAIIYLFTAELFPTVVRTTGVGAGSMSARIGALLAPFIADLRVLWLPLPTVVFGVLALAAGFLSFFLPETLGENLPDTLEEGEEFGKNMKIFELYRPRRLPEKYENDYEEQLASLTATI